MKRSCDHVLNKVDILCEKKKKEKKKKPDLAIFSFPLIVFPLIVYLLSLKT